LIAYYLYHSTEASDGVIQKENFATNGLVMAVAVNFDLVQFRRDLLQRDASVDGDFERDVVARSLNIEKRGALASGMVPDGESCEPRIPHYNAALGV
jgi:hypothetical protein